MNPRPNIDRWGIWTVVITGGLIIVGVVGSCGVPNDVLAERERRARAPGEFVTIAAAWPWSIRSEGLYSEGLQLAVDEINDRGGILGRQILIRREDDRESVNEGRLVAQRLGEDPDVVAVIGHLNSHVSIPASAIYERYGLLMITPGSTSPELTRRGHNLIFRSVNGDDDIARNMAEFARNAGYGRLAIGYVRNAYGLGLANAFEEYAHHHGLEVVDRQSYDPASSSSPSAYQRMVGLWDDLEFDALFLAGMAPQAGYLVRQIRNAGLTMPILGGDALDTPELIESAGTAAHGMVVASVFHPDDPHPEVQRFVQTFRSSYGRSPDSWAARGYEAMRLLAEAMESAGSTVPSDVASRLHSSNPSFSLSGPVSFNRYGDVVGRRLVTVVVRDEEFAYFDRTKGDKPNAPESLIPHGGDHARP